MDQGDVKAIEFVKINYLVPDERQIQIARARTIRIEGRSILPAFSRDGAAAEHYTGSFRHTRPDHVTKLSQTIRVSPERKPGQSFTHLFVGQFLSFLIFLGHTTRCPPIKHVLFRRTPTELLFKSRTWKQAPYLHHAVTFRHHF